MNLVLIALKIVAEFVLFGSLAMMIGQATIWFFKRNIKNLDQNDGTFKVPKTGLYEVVANTMYQNGTEETSKEILELEVPPNEIAFDPFLKKNVPRKLGASPALAAPYGTTEKKKKKPKKKSSLKRKK